MDKKLTLKLDKEIIDKAKRYASEHNTSLSRLVENYLASITSHQQPATPITPLVDSLSGIIELSDDFDHKEQYTDHLSHKHQ